MFDGVAVGTDRTQSNRVYAVVVTQHTCVLQKRVCSVIAHQQRLLGESYVFHLGTVGAKPVTRAGLDI